jgi:hypothetical protein
MKQLYKCTYYYNHLIGEGRVKICDFVCSDPSQEVLGSLFERKLISNNSVRNEKMFFKIIN